MFSGGFAGILSRDTMRGSAQADARLDTLIPPSEGATCELKVEEGSDEGTWEATLRDGAIEGAFKWSSGSTMPFIADIRGE